LALIPCAYPAGIRDATGLANVRGATYFALSRDTATANLGHGWTFSTLVGLIPSYTTWARQGCNTPCVDNEEMACGQAFEGQTTWALYKRM
jgi:hypothetical protein